MSSDPNEVVKLASGTLVEAESWAQWLTEAGIQSRVVGVETDPAFGGGANDPIEVWVHQADLERAAEVLRQAEAERDKSQSPRDEAGE